MTKLSAQMCAITNAVLDFLTLPSVMMVTLCGEDCDCLNAWLSFRMCEWVSSSEEDRGEWKVILLEK